MPKYTNAQNAQRPNAINHTQVIKMTAQNVIIKDANRHYNYKGMFHFAIAPATIVS